ncbi:MAG: hypothetical protein Satyrvirus9_15 [Satyrvirus sp.]|uniref:Uncharacterized protein n=1 Tax=Satyrvirus sp. TaxID=2487771 RepID=A0A3G5AIP5_9VIRU|nr:MAG: hypothetical protein Satyrvirus9_15 [Satyrvirus sp.]
MSQFNILFFSNNCEGSKHLISLMQSENLIRFFHLICTDNNPKIPPQIKVTPTLIIRGVSAPYVAGDAFSWFAKIKQWKINLLMQTISSTQQQYLQSINNNLVLDDSNILGFSQIEMNGMSDIFSFFSKNITQEREDPLPQSFFVFNNIGNENIFTPPKEDIKDIDDKKQKLLCNDLEVDRKKQDTIFKQGMDKFIKQYSINKN